MIIDSISDLHGYFPKLEGGDLLLIAGDLTSRDEPEQHHEFCDWLDTQTYSKKIIIAGNHDGNICKDEINSMRNCIYLEDSGTEFEGLKIWGSPRTPLFHGVNPKCKHFMLSERALFKKFELIPSDTNILITHGPPWGIFDESTDGTECGSMSLRNVVLSRGRLPKLDLHVFGHIHELGGYATRLNGLQLANVSIVDECYQKKRDFYRFIL